MGSKPKLSGPNSLKSLLIAVAISGILILYTTFVIFFMKSYSWPASELFSPLRQIFPCSQITPSPNNSPTSVNHIVFGLLGLGSMDSWRHRKDYIESWWRPNVTRGYLYLDTVPPEDLLPWPATSPPFRLCDDISKIVDESRLRVHVFKMAHIILQLHREERKDVRWYVMGDDDSIFFVDNWADVLSKYDHTKYVYIGGHSESLWSNFKISFEQGFGGGGIAMSYALVSALVKDLEGCMRRYRKNLRHFDLIIQHCVDDLGVSLSAEKGIHQIDLVGDISGFLSSHPQAPLLSLHHFDVVDPIFPSMNRTDSTKHLMKSANIDQSRLLQQTICYDRQTQWSVSVSWGYSVQIYEKVFPKSYLKRPLETFRPWKRLPPPRYMFNTRELPFRDPSCEAPHVFFMESVEKIGINQIVSTYVRSRPRGVPPCFRGNNSTDYISTVRVLSPATKPVWGDRSECCDIITATDSNIVDVKYRACMRDEIVG